MVRTIRTTRQDIYIRLVENAASQDGRDSDSGDFIFKYQYELFSLGVVVGYVEGEQIPDPDEPNEDSTDSEVEWSQEILKLTNLDTDHDHRVPIDIINQLVLMESDDPDDEDLEDVWTDVLRYADAGVEYIDEGIAVQDDFDLIGTVRDFSNPEWRERLRDVIVSPEARQ
jgi:hypothetical protein